MLGCEVQLCNGTVHMLLVKNWAVFTATSKSNFGTACLRDTQICDEMFLADRKKHTVTLDMQASFLQMKGLCSKKKKKDCLLHWLLSHNTV